MSCVIIKKKSRRYVMNKKIVSITAGCAVLITGIAAGAAAALRHTPTEMKNVQNFVLTGSGEVTTEYDLNSDGAVYIFDVVEMRKEFGSEKTDSNAIVVYFSQTGNTEKIAEYLIDITGADSYVIEAAVPYTAADIKYQDNECRANKEQNDKAARPEIKGLISGIEKYDVVYLGYPIWWGEEPRIIDTFIESVDLSNAVIVPFCTSGSSGIAKSEKNIAELGPKYKGQLTGRRFASSASRDDVEKWVNSLELPMNTKEQAAVNVKIGGKDFKVEFYNNKTTKELLSVMPEYLPMTLNMNELNGNEKYVNLTIDLPTESSKPDMIHAGDVMLYGNNCIVLFYKDFETTYSYTPIGRIKDTSGLAEAVGKGNISVEVTD